MNKDQEFIDGQYKKYFKLYYPITTWEKEKFEIVLQHTIDTIRKSCAETFSIGALNLIMLNNGKLTNKQYLKIKNTILTAPIQEGL